jgi:multiple sugar transport system permease protein
LASWVKVIGDPGSMRALLNSYVVSFATTLLVLVLATPAAYSLARFEFPIRSKHINFWLFSQRVMPPVVVLVPFFILLAQLGLVDTRDRAYSYLYDFQFGVCCRDHARRVSRHCQGHR